MLRRCLFALVTLVATPVAAAENIVTFTLDNGLEAVVIEDHRAPAVVHMLWYKAGAADEPPGVSGIAHFLEHLLFKATDKLEAGEFSAIVEANGGSDNAFTSFDYTGYFQRVAADRLGLMMEMEANRMTNIRLTEEDIVTERDVILEERSQRTDSDPGALFSEQRSAALYLNHPYGIPIIGWRHEMEQLDMADVMAFYDAHYAPNNAVLVVAGDVDPAEVEALAKQHYGPIPANFDIPERTRPQEPPQLAERRLIFEDPRVSQPYVIRSYLAPERDSGDQERAAALSMLANVLGGSSATSVFGKKLELGDRKAVYTSAFYRGLSLDDTSFGVVIVPTPDLSLKEAEAEMDAAIAEFMEEGVDAEQLERIKTQIRASEVYAQDDVNGLARRYGSALTAGLTVEDLQAWPNILQAVTEEQIMAAAEMIFNRDNAVTGWYQKPTDQELEQEVSQ